jgi:hypothetical protein
MEEGSMSNNWIRQLATVLLAAITLAACAQTPPGKEDPKSRLVTAEAMFAERCKKAGVFIHRTAENVEGVFLMKIRPSDINYGDQYKLDDPYGRDHGGDIFIQSLLRGFNTPPSKPTAFTPVRLGYRYVEALDPKDDKRYRYTGGIKEVTHTTSILMGGDGKTTFKTKDFVLDKIPAPGAMPRLWRHLRRYLHPRRTRLLDRRQFPESHRPANQRSHGRAYRLHDGSGAGESKWWTVAMVVRCRHACPTFQRNPNFPLQPGHGASAQRHQTEDFVESILKPILEK